MKIKLKVLAYEFDFVISNKTVCSSGEHSKLFLIEFNMRG